MRENPLPLLILFAAIAILPGLVSAQQEAPAQTVPTERKEQLVEIKRTRKMVARGPRYKNPLAAGRLVAVNRAKRSRQGTQERRDRTRERLQRRRSSFSSLAALRED